MTESGDPNPKGSRSKEDPLEDATAPYAVPGERAPGRSAEDADTTRFSGETAPPILIEEETVVSSPHEEAIAEDDAPAGEASIEAERARAEAEATVVAVSPSVDDPEDEDPDPTVVEAVEETAPSAAVPDEEETPPPSPVVEEELDPTVVEVTGAGDGEAADAVAPNAPEPPGATPVAAAADATRVEPAPAETDTRGAIPPSSSLHPMLLERVEPSLGRGERLRLDAAHWHVRIGRAEHNDIRLYTASASREQAEIRGNEAGEWVLTPLEGKSVLVDGDPVDAPIVLEVGMNLVMGGDHLRCVTEGLDRSEMAAQTAAEGLGDESASSGLAGIAWTWWAIGVIAALGVGLLAFAWFTG